jgi:hypothetical protein
MTVEKSGAAAQAVVGVGADEHRRIGAGQAAMNDFDAAGASFLTAARWPGRAPPVAAARTSSLLGYSACAARLRGRNTGVLSLRAPRAPPRGMRIKACWRVSPLSISSR